MIAVSTQTDPPRAKLCKEVCVDSSDLIVLVDAGILTDGNVVLKDTNDGKLVMTHSVSQMTDPTTNSEIGTQTVLPRSPIDLKRFLKAPPISQPSNQETREDQLLRQIEELINLEDLEPEVLEKETFKNSSADSDSDATVSADSLHQTPPPVKTKKSHGKEFFLHPEKKPTPSYWSNLDFSDDEDKFPKLPRSTVANDTDRGTLQDFRNIIIGQRLSNMRLSPIPPRIRRPNKKVVTWTDSQQKAVSQLISEANALNSLFDQVSCLLGPDIKLNDVPAMEEYSGELFTSKWDTVLSESCDRLEEQLNSYTPLDLRDLQKFQREETGSF